MSDSTGGSQFPDSIDVPVGPAKDTNSQIRFDATAVIAELYTGPLVAYLRRKRNANLEDAREVVQEFFLSLIHI